MKTTPINKQTKRQLSFLSRLQILNNRKIYCLKNMCKTSTVPVTFNKKIRKVILNKKNISCKNMPICLWTPQQWGNPLTPSASANTKPSAALLFSHRAVHSNDGPFLLEEEDWLLCHPDLHALFHDCHPFASVVLAQPRVSASKDCLWWENLAAKSHYHAKYGVLQNL